MKWEHRSRRRSKQSKQGRGWAPYLWVLLSIYK